MIVTATKITDIDLARRCLESTMRSTPGFSSRITARQLYQCEHSPIRALQWIVELTDLKTFVSVHFVRHKIGVEHFGVEHFVQSNRADRLGDTKADRDTPLDHTMLLNAQVLITLARKRLCYQASAETRYVMMAIRDAIGGHDPDLADYMVQECAYRGGYCPELRPCGNWRVRKYDPQQILKEISL